MTDALVFDTETSGLVANLSVRIERQPEVIEFAGVVVDVDTGEQKHTYSTLIRPSFLLRELGEEGKRIGEITSITDEMLLAAPSFREVSREIRFLIEGADMAIAHNLSFDRNMIDIEFRRLGEPPVRWPRDLFCTVEQTAHLAGASFRLSLSHLHEMLFHGEKHADAHRAEADVKALVRCVLELRRRGEL